MAESEGNQEPDLKSGIGVDDIRSNASETVYKRTLEPVFNAMDGKLLVAIACVASLTYTANLEVNWSVITLAGMIFLCLAVASLLRRSRQVMIREGDGLTQCLYASVAAFVISLPFITYLATVLAQMHMAPSEAVSCFWLVGCFHPVTWIYWCYFCAGLLHSVGAIWVLSLQSKRKFPLHGQATTRRVLLSAVLVAGVGGAATDVVSIAPYEVVQKLQHDTLFFERPANLARWAILCLLLWLGVFGSLVVEVVRGYRKKAS